MRKQAIYLAALLAVAPAWAINKCTVDGRVVFQDKPCVAGTGGQIDVRPASGEAPRAAPETGAPAAAAAPTTTTPAAAPVGRAPATEAERLEGVLANSQAMRRRIELESLLVPNAKAAVEQNRARCDAEMRQLRTDKGRAHNNLAGATWESSLSQEMQAVATRCDTQQREKRDEFEALRKECVGLGGCKRM